MKKFRKHIKRNLFSGDCGLWYNVITYNHISHTYSNHVCPYNKCSSYQDAILYFLKHFYKPFHSIISIEHHKLSAKDIYYMSLAC